VSAENVRAGQGVGKLGKFPEFGLFAVKLIGKIPGKNNPKNRKAMYRFQGKVSGVQRTFLALSLAVVGLVTDGMCIIASAQLLDTIATFQGINTACAPIIREQPQSVALTVGDPMTLAIGAEDCVVGLPPTASRTALGAGADRFVFQTGYRAGVLLLECDLFTLPDSVRVYYEGQLIFDEASAGFGQFMVSYGPGDATSVEIVINEESDVSQATAWQYTVRYRPLPPTFQWRKDGEDLAYEAGATLHIASVSLAEAGDYSVVVTGQNGSVVSAVATVAVQPVDSTNCVVAPADLVSWWAAEGNAADRAGLNQGVLSGGVSYAAGKVGNAFAFSNYGEGAVKFGASPSLDVGTGEGFTVEGWILRTGTAPSVPIAEWNDGSRWGSHFWVLNDRLYANLTSPGGGWHLVMSTIPVPVGVWHHVAMSYEKANGTVRLFLNGSVVTEEVIGEFSPETGFDFYLGRRPAPSDQLDSFEGFLDEFSLYRRALSTSEIASIYRSGSNGKCVTNEPPPVVVHDVSQDFSASANPSGVWSYGYSATLGGTFHLLTFPKTYGANNGVSISGWQVTDAWGPSVNRVMGNGIAVSEGGAFTAPSGTVYVWPGNDGSPGVFGVIRFTVPAGGGGVYRIESAARSNFDGPVSGDSDFHVMKNSQELFSRFLAPNSATGWTNTLNLASGDSVDFVVGKGADGSPDHSSLKVHAVIALVTNAPPPTNHSFDLSADFSLAANPNGPWSYGHLTGSLGGNFELLNTTRSFGAENAVPISVWFLNDAKPFVAKVLGPGTAVSYLFNASAGTIYFGPNPDATPHDFAAIRFTVPVGAGGLYQLETAVRSLYDSTRSADADFHVVRNGVELFGRLVLPNSSASYSNLLALAAGDRIDFVAGRGTNGLPETGLKIQATIRSVSVSFMSVDAVSVLTSGGIRVSGHGPRGATCRVERSMNLVDWEYVGSAVETGAGVFEFIDSEPPGGACFYRIASAGQ